MAITKEDIKYIAKLAKLQFTEEEAVIFAHEFENILQQFKSLDELNIEDVEIEIPKTSVVRKDICKKCEIDNLYRNSEKMRETSIEVPKIIE